MMLAGSARECGRELACAAARDAEHAWREDRDDDLFA
jgi:hypothetical protein